MPQGTDINIDPKKMSSVAGIIEIEQRRIDSCYQNIQNICGQIMGEWEGTSAEFFLKAIKELNEQSPLLVSILREYVSDLKKIAQEFTITENIVTANSQALPSDVFGV